jgi:hypothetical protein
MMNAIVERPREGVTIPRIWLMVALSVLLHAAVLWQALPKLHRMTLDEPEQGANSSPLAVRLAPPPSPAAPAQREEAPAVTARPPPPPVRQRAPAPPVIALNKAPAAPAPSPAPPAEAAPPRAPAELDFATMVEARRRAREGAAPSQPSPGMIAAAPAETEAERARRITSANLAPKQIVFGYDPNAGGGVFQIRSLNFTNAEVTFYGWNREIKRKTMQIIEISKGNNSDIRIAVVRKMIAIIREYETDDFRWESRGRTVTLSARLRDNAGLEEYMLREFFPDQAVAR